MKITGSINVANVVTIPSQGYKSANGHMFSVQMISTDLSKETTLTLQLSLDGTNWDNAVEAGTDITDTVVANVAKVVSYEVNAGVFWRIAVTAGSTGTISYIILD